MMRPFRLPDGKITREAWKALVLQLDPNDDEAERAVRMAIEKRNARRLRQILADINGRMVAAMPEDFNPITDTFDLQRSARLTRAEEQELEDALNRMLQESADLGVNVAVDQFENVGMGFDWTMANTEARDWAASYTPQLSGQINATTERMIGQSVSRWIGNGEPLESLIEDIAPVFGRSRAELIASTEITRAFSHGAEIAYRESGLIDRPPNMRPPEDTHPRCRCGLSLIEKDGEWWYRWDTANDERVCPICGPLHGTLQ